MPKYWNGLSSPRSSASQSRNSTAIRPPNQPRTSSPSVRSGVAVRPTRTWGRTCDRRRRTLPPPRGGTRRRSPWRSDRRQAAKVQLRERLDRREDVAPLGGIAPPTYSSPNAPSRITFRKVLRLWSRISLRWATKSSVLTVPARGGARSRAPRPPSCRSRSPSRRGSSIDRGVRARLGVGPAPPAGRGMVERAAGRSRDRDRGSRRALR